MDPIYPPDLQVRIEKKRARDNPPNGSAEKVARVADPSAPFSLSPLPPLNVTHPLFTGPAQPPCPQEILRSTPPFNAFTDLYVPPPRKLFQDHEIVTIHPLEKIKELDLGAIVMQDDEKRSVIQQQGLSGCTAAAAAMLIFDRGGLVDSYSLIRTQAGNTASTFIANAGMTPKVKEIQSPPKSANERMNTTFLHLLRASIFKNGPAIVGMNGDIGPHVVIVDEIEEDISTVRLRDPFHGWSITVTKKAFVRVVGTTDILEIRE